MKMESKIRGKMKLRKKILVAKKKEVNKQTNPSYFMELNSCS